MDDRRITPETLVGLEADLPLDEAFDALSDPLARYTVYHLHDHPTTTLDDLADAVVALDAGTDGVAPRSDREGIRTALYHATLPKLDALGYVDFDARNRTVARARIPRFVYGLIGVEDPPVAAEDCA